jgi:ribosomal protein S18 acetylase RimI-like enzyme
MSALITIRKVDYLNGRDAADLTVLLDLYARDPMGGARPLAPAVLQRVCSDLASRPNAASFIADWHPSSGSEQGISVAVGLINCFEGYSTFKAKPLLNIHDIVVHPDYRGRGVAQALLGAAQELAMARGCCKLTLEVLSGNVLAMRSYDSFGFAPYALDPAAGSALLMQKWLPESSSASARDAPVITAGSGRHLRAQ